MSNVNVEKEFPGLFQLALASIKSYAAYERASKGTSAADAATVANLEQVAKADRAAFNKRLRQVIGDPTSLEGHENGKSWNIYVQKAFVSGLVPNGNPNVFRYLDANEVVAKIMRNTAQAYLQGHQVLGWTVRYGVNRKSVRDLRDALVEALKVAEANFDGDKTLAVRTALFNLERSAKNLLEDRQTTAAPQQTAAASIGEQIGSAATQEVMSATPAPSNRRGGRKAQAR